VLIRRDDTAMRTLRSFDPPRSAGRVRGATVDLAEESGQVDGRDVQLARLEERIEILQASIGEAEVAHEKAVEAALERGREEGRRAADELGAERLAALREELATASRECLSQFAEKSDLAVAIARAAIQKVLGEASTRAEIAGEIARNAIAQVGAGTTIAVRVSSADFGSDEELAALERELGAMRIVRDDELRAGDCRLDLTLGTVDASLGVQLAALDRELGRVGNGGVQ